MFDRGPSRWALAHIPVRETRCVTANVLQTKVDAQCDKLATIVVSSESCQFKPISHAFGASVEGDAV